HPPHAALERGRRCSHLYGTRQQHVALELRIELAVAGDIDELHAGEVTGKPFDHVRVDVTQHPHHEEAASATAVRPRRGVDGSTTMATRRGGGGSGCCVQLQAWPAPIALR